MLKPNLKLVCVALCGIWFVCFATANAVTWENEQFHNSYSDTAIDLHKKINGDITPVVNSASDHFGSFNDVYNSLQNETLLTWWNGTVAPCETTTACFATNANTVSHKHSPWFTFPPGFDPQIAGPALSTDFQLVGDDVAFTVSNECADGGTITITSIQMGPVQTIWSLNQLKYPLLDDIVWEEEAYNEVLEIGETISFLLNAPKGGAIVYRAKVYYNDGTGDTVLQCGQYAESFPIPTLTEWGLIIFGVVLIGFITYVFLRRRKAIAVRV